MLPVLRKTYALVFEEWKAHPFNIVIGAFKNWFDYLMPRGAGAFGFIRGTDSLSWINLYCPDIFVTFSWVGFGGFMETT